jgi:hypothetical protein
MSYISLFTVAFKYTVLLFSLFVTYKAHWQISTSVLTFSNRLFKIQFILFKQQINHHEASDGWIFNLWYLQQAQRWYKFEHKDVALTISTIKKKHLSPTFQPYQDVVVKLITTTDYQIKHWNNVEVKNPYIVS